MGHEQPTPKRTPGLIQSGTMYTLNELKARMGWKDSAFREACRNGLTTFRCGKRVYTRGEDVISYITKNAKNTPPGSP